MRSVITRFSITNARGGAVSQDIEFLEVEEARRLLLASTATDATRMENDIRHHEFPLNLFNIQSSLLTNVLYGANGSGKTTFLKLMQDAGAFIQSVFSISLQRGNATDNDLIDWHEGRIPRAYQHPLSPNQLRFEDLNENLVVESIRSSMRDPRKGKEGVDKANKLRFPMRSSFSFTIEGVFAPPFVWPDDHSADMKFTCELRPISGFEWFGNERLQQVNNFTGAFYVVHLRLDAFEDEYIASIANDPDTALLDIVAGENRCSPFWSEYNIPVLVHPNEGILPLGRIVMDPETKVSDEFLFEDEAGEPLHSFEEPNMADGKRNPEFSLFRNLVVGKAVGDLKLIEDGEISSPDCNFFRHAAVFSTEGFPGDFFLSPTEDIIQKSKDVALFLPSLLNEEHGKLWLDYWREGVLDEFDSNNPYQSDEVLFSNLRTGDITDIRDLVATLNAGYSFSPDYIPKPLRSTPPEPGTFRERFVNDDPNMYLHLIYTLDPPETALEGVLDDLQFKAEIPRNLLKQLEALEQIYEYLEGENMNMPWNDHWLYLVRVDDLEEDDLEEEDLEFGDMEEPDGTPVSTLDAALSYYTGKYTGLGYDEGLLEGAAMAEVRNFIVSQLEYLWFEGVPKRVANQKLELMNELLVKHTGLTALQPIKSLFNVGNKQELFFSPESLWNVKSGQKIEFEHLSSGQRNLFSLISILGSEGDGPILIDEPELSLHMEWQLAMKDIVQSLVNHSKRQVFIASHSPDVILKFDDRSFPLLGEEVSDVDA